MSHAGVMFGFPTAFRATGVLNTVGRWVYSNDYGWYWVSEESEASWGWVTFHYGRWVWINDTGWAWVPGNEWGPAWVDWRRGDRYVGWAPLPPDDLIADMRDDSLYWTFVQPADFLAPRIESVVVRSEPAFFRDTIVVNETVAFRQRGFAVNPGIEPAILAAAIRRPIPQFQVRPRVFAGTAQLPNAIQVRPNELGRADFRRSIARETNIRQTNNVIRPASSVPKPQPLGHNEHGRLGQNPPSAASGLARQTPQNGIQPQPGTNATAPNQQRERGATGPTTPQQQRGLSEPGPNGALSGQQRERGTGPTAEQLRGRNATGPTAEQQQRGRNATGPTAEQQQRGRNATGPTAEQQQRGRNATGRTAEQQRGRTLYDRAMPGQAPQRGPERQPSAHGPMPSQMGSGGPRERGGVASQLERGSGVYNRASPGAGGGAPPQAAPHPQGGPPGGGHAAPQAMPHGGGAPPGGAGGGGGGHHRGP